MIKKDQYPVELLKGIEPLLQKFKQLENSHASIIMRIDDSDSGLFKRKGLVHLNFCPRKKDLKFYFRITDLTLQEAWFTAKPKVKYLYNYSPYSKTIIKSPNSNGYIGDLDAIVEDFEKWVILIQEYSVVKLTEEEIWLSNATKEFYTEFQITDKDAKTEYFNTDQQIFIYKLLNFLEGEVSKTGRSDPKVSEIINDIKNLKNAIPDLTKEKLIQDLAGIFAKIKKFGIKLLADIFDVAKKEIIKKALYGGVEEMHYLIHHIF